MLKRNLLFTCFLGSELGVISRKPFDSSNDELCRFSAGEYIRVCGNVRGVCSVNLLFT